MYEYSYFTILVQYITYEVFIQAYPYSILLGSVSKLLYEYRTNIAYARLSMGQAGIHPLTNRLLQNFEDN